MHALVLEQTKRNWKMQNENETELKTEKEKMKSYSSTRGKTIYLYKWRLLSMQVTAFQLTLNY
jgi:hypothetical protein